MEPAEASAPAVNLLALDLAILRKMVEIDDAHTEPGRGSVSSTDLSGHLNIDAGVVWGRLRDLMSAGLIRATDKWLAAGTFLPTPKGHNLVVASAGVDLESPELTAATASIRAEKGSIDGFNVDVEEVKLRRNRSRSAIGAKLKDVKAALPYGLWLMWLKYHFAWSEDTAERHMKFAERFPVSALTRDTLPEQETEWRRLYRNKPQPKPKGLIIARITADKQGKATWKSWMKILCDKWDVKDDGVALWKTVEEKVAEYGRA
jgi:hypothetical protein